MFTVLVLLFFLDTLKKSSEEEEKSSEKEQSTGHFQRFFFVPSTLNLIFSRKSTDKKIWPKGAKIRDRYNQVPHLTQDTNGKVTKAQLYTTNESQEVNPSPAGDHKAQINKRALSTAHKGITNTRQKKTDKRSSRKVPPWNGQENILLEGLNL